MRFGRIKPLLLLGEGPPAAGDILRTSGKCTWPGELRPCREAATRPSAPSRYAVTQRLARGGLRRFPNRSDVVTSPPLWSLFD
jgi:hypothetical protein